MEYQEKNKNNAGIKTLQTAYEIKDKDNRSLFIKYEDSFSDKVIEIDGQISINNIQILITALTELQTDFGDEK